MLVLSRNEGQAITIGDEIKVIVLRVSGGRVRLGVEAPRELLVLRKDDWEYTKKQEAK